MKNVHLIPTDKPSRLHLGDSGLVLCDFYFSRNTINGQNIYITDNSEIIEGDWVLDLHNQIWKLLEGKLIGFDNQGNKRFSTDNIEAHNPKKIILTTDLQLIADGVQAIDDEFLEWFVKNPSCERVEVEEKQHFEFDKSKRINPLNGVYYSYKIIIPSEEPKQEYKYIGECNGNNDNGCFLDSPAHDCGCFIRVVKEKPKQETLEEAAINCWAEGAWDNRDDFTDGFIEGAKSDVAKEYWFEKFQQEQDKKMYSEEEVEVIAKDAYTMGRNNILIGIFNIWFKQFKKK